MYSNFNYSKNSHLRKRFWLNTWKDFPPAEISEILQLIVTRVLTARSEVGIPAGSRGFSLLRNFHRHSGFHKASYWKGHAIKRQWRIGWEINLTILLHPVLTLRISTFTLFSPCNFSWRGDGYSCLSYICTDCINYYCLNAKLREIDSHMEQICSVPQLCPD